ncbi:sugar nucleotide-binding protein [Dermatobacter hominis]|uniref:sugar nucleotide-binding protein n=1 Tax=Dermatobacter hominis TaxID=2884263 RepID=UPI001D11DCFF|nr:sugar nucleotide-binding protein [Dermatobacter hominis]UDY36946.1 sugar nucleotide-binding protein [Dermatobacter hominis]
MATRSPRRVLVTGGAGNVAGWLARTVPGDVELHVTRHRTPVPVDVAAVATVHGAELTDAAATVELVRAVRPEVVVHTAYVQSDRAAIVDATASVAGAAADVGASLVHLSTDVVFAGDRPPYAEDAPTDPITDYGRWKVEAERAAREALPDVCTTRTSLVVSTDPMDRSTGALAAALATGQEVRLFHDELRQPIRADDLAAELWALVALDRARRAGAWHLPGPEHLSRLELGLRLAARLGLDAGPVVATSAADHATPRPRDPELMGARRVELGVRLRPVDG